MFVYFVYINALNITSLWKKYNFERNYRFTVSSEKCTSFCTNGPNVTAELLGY